jgi:hypothetical protein
LTVSHFSSPRAVRVIPVMLLAVGLTGAAGKGYAAPKIAPSAEISIETQLFAPETPSLAQSPLKPDRYPIPRVPPPPPYIPRIVTADQWAFPVRGFAVDGVLTDATERCLMEESTDSISGWIPKNLRCARVVSVLLRRSIPKFQGHDRAETCARRIRKTFQAKRSRVFNLQDQIENAPDGYLYVICLLKNARSNSVAHIAFYDPDTKGILGNSKGKWKSQPLEKYWPKYRAYYLLGIPRSMPTVALP